MKKLESGGTRLQVKRVKKPTKAKKPRKFHVDIYSMGTWFIRSPNEKDWIDCGDKEQVLKIIHPEGPKCPFTNRMLDVSNGCWVHQFPSRLDMLQVGYHVPQIIIPNFANNPKDWYDIYKVFAGRDITDFLQEVMGIPVAEGARELAEEDMKRICVLGTKADGLARVKKGTYKYIVSGCDWGGSPYQVASRTKVSFTVHVILGVLSNGDIDILHMRRYSGMDYDEISHYIAGEHQAYGGNLIASDFGVGMGYNGELRKKLPPHRHLIFGYVGPKTKIISVPKDGMFNQYSLNKSEAVTAAVLAIKSDKPRIRCYEWGTARDYLMDCVNLYRTPVENQNGESTMQFIKNPSKTDDTLHAIIFGYTAARIALGEPLFEDAAMRDYIMNTLRLRPAGNTIMGGGGIISG